MCSNGYTTPNMAWDSSPQSTSASEALTRGAAPTNTHPPMVTEADSAHYRSPESLLNSEVSTDHGPKQNSSLLKLLLTPKSTAGTPSSWENGHSTHHTSSHCCSPEAPPPDCGSPEDRPAQLPVCRACCEWQQLITCSDQWKCVHTGRALSSIWSRHTVGEYTAAIAVAHLVVDSIVLP